MTERDHADERRQAWRLGVLSGLTVACAGVLLYLAQLASSYTHLYAGLRAEEGLPLGTVLAINPALSYGAAAAITIAVVFANKVSARRQLSTSVASTALAVGALSVGFVYWYATQPMRQLSDAIISD